MGKLGYERLTGSVEDVLYSKRGMSLGLLSEVGTSELRLGMGLSWNHWPTMRRTDLSCLLRNLKSRSTGAKGVVFGIEVECGAGFDGVGIGACGEIVESVNERLGQQVDADIEESNHDGVDFAGIQAFDGRGGGKDGVGV